MAKADQRADPSPDDLADDSTSEVRAGGFRTFRCMGCDALKKVSYDRLDQDHDKGLRTGCPNCGSRSPHLPTGAKDLAFYRWRNALIRAGDFTWVEEDDDEADEDAEGRN